MQKVQQRVATTLTVSREYLGNHAGAAGVALDAPATRQLDAALDAVNEDVLPQGTASLGPLLSAPDARSKRPN